MDYRWQSLSLLRLREYRREPGRHSLEMGRKGTSQKKPQKKYKKRETRIVSRSSKEEVKALRSSKGPLKKRLLKPKTMARYFEAMQLLFLFWEICDSAPMVWDDLGSSVEAFIEHLYQEADTLRKGYDCLSALAFFEPNCHMHLRVARRMLRHWQTEEPPERPVGLTPEAVLGLAGFCVRLSLTGMAAILSAGFDAFFRTGELFALRVKDIDIVNDGAVVRLDPSKSLQRALSVNTLAEAVVIESKLAIKWLKVACKGKSGEDFVLGIKPHLCRKKIGTMIDFLGTQGKLSFYSLRRGGASWHFHAHNNIDKTAIRGRWAHTSTARVYVQSCLAEKQRLQLTPQQKSALGQLAKYLQ